MMSMNLREKIRRLESARGRGVIEILREHHDGTATVTTIRSGRVVSRKELSAAEAAKLAVGAITIERAYVGPRG
jgi:hypothetical protein